MHIYTFLSVYWVKKCDLYCYKTCKKKDLAIVCFFISVKKLGFVGNGNTIHEKGGRENLRSQVMVEFVCAPDNPVGMQCATQVQTYDFLSFSIYIRTLGLPSNYLISIQFHLMKGLNFVPIITLNRLFPQSENSSKKKFPLKTNGSIFFLTLAPLLISNK